MKCNAENPSLEYLCQVDESVSCGACCGLYNVRDASFEALKARLSHRTDLYNKLPNDIDAIEAFKKKTQAEECSDKPIGDFHHCPYIGLIGENKSRVGCLLHPMNPKNKDFDFRGLSHYGGMTCRVYFCPSATQLPDVYGKIVKSVADNWYVYGLIITETRLLKNFFREIERQIGQSLNTRETLSNQQAKDAVRDFFELKIKWPYRKKGRSYLGNYFFKDNLYPKPKIDYHVTNRSVSPHNKLLEELASEFNSESSMKSAERLLDNIFHRIKTALK